MMVKPMKTHKLHYPMIQFLVTGYIQLAISVALHLLNIPYAVVLNNFTNYSLYVDLCIAENF